MESGRQDWDWEILSERMMFSIRRIIWRWGLGGSAQLGSTLRWNGISCKCEVYIMW